MTVLGEYLKGIRLQRKLSLKDVYRATGISDSKLSRVENGSNDPAPDILRDLSKLYDVDLVKLYCMAGYLNEEALPSCKQVFQNANLLTEDERDLIQRHIDMLTKGR